MMVWKVALLFLAGLILASGASLNDAGDHKNRVLHGQKLSEKDHFDAHGEENYDYDHEAFLGRDGAHEFDDLDPEESKRRLSIIVDKIDKDNDGFVTLEEMRNWIRFTQDRYTTGDVERQWKQHNPDDKDEIGWEQYRKLVYGFLDDNIGDEHSEEDNESYRRMEDRDRRRWDMADENKDGSLTKLEFKHFLHPEEVEHMRDIVIDETIEDIDKDGDGKLSLEEYIGDMYINNGTTSEDEEPDWVKRERTTFKEFRDWDKDGYLNVEEVRGWILPQEFDIVDAEAKHLLSESDKDGDKKLTKHEILDKYDIFVGSQATEFGEALNRHDEF